MGAGSTRSATESAQKHPRSRLDRLRVTDAHNRSLLYNAASLFGTTVLTAGFGAAYWALAARIYPAAAVGLAAAAISAMILIGRLATLGLGTVLMGELSQHRGSKRGLIYSATSISALVGTVIGAAFIVAAGRIAPELRALSEPVGIFVFAIGVASTSSGFVLDQAFIGLLRGGIQLVRNTIASIAKLIALAAIGVVGLAFPRLDGQSLFSTWVIGGVVSMAVIIAIPRASGAATAVSLWRLPEGLVGLALRHHLLNLSILAPSLLLPVLVTGLLSAEANAYFYIAYTIANLGWAVPAALATALYASGARDLDALSSRLRLSFWLSVGTGVLFNLFMSIGARPLLSLFGPTYANQAESLLLLLSLGIFPVTITSMYVPIIRLERRFLQGTAVMIGAMLTAFAGVVIGAGVMGLNGAGAGWLIGASVGSLPLLPTVFRVAVRRSVEPVEGDVFGRLPDVVGNVVPELDPDV